MAPARNTDYRKDQQFFTQMAIAITILVFVGFGQWQLRGRVDYAKVPYWVTLHGIVFTAWFGLFVTQNMLALRGSLALHRRLGWLALLIVPLVVVLTCVSGYMAVRLGRVPPFYTPAQFLALTHGEALGFGGLVMTAIIFRRKTEWHRRLMLMATVVTLAPALGRTLPMMVLGVWGPIIMTGVMLATVAVCMVHDRRLNGQAHPATFVGAGVICAIFIAEELLMRCPPFIAFAQGLAIGG